MTTHTPPSQHQILRAVGDRIASLRKRSGLTQDQLSELAEIDIQAIQRAESGRAALSLERLARIAAALGVALPDLFTLEITAATAPDWSSDEAQVVAAYRAVPSDRRVLVLPLLGVLRR